MANLAKKSTQKSIAPPHPKTPLIDVRSPLFVPRYAGEVLKGLLRRHRPRLHDFQVSASFRSRARNTNIERWHRFAGHRRDQHLPVPFTYLNGAGAFCLAKLMQRLQINFSQVMHQKAEIHLTQAIDAIHPDKIYTLDMRVHEIIPLQRKLLLVTESNIHDGSGTTLRRHLDYWHVRNAPCQQATLPHPATLELRQLSQRPPSWQSWLPDELKTSRFHLPHDAARHYATLSGDYTPHATTWGARLFGQNKPFLQGFGLLNLALHHVTQTAGETLGHLEIVFARPALTNQEITLHVSHRQFEMCNETNELLAFGKFSHGILAP